MNISKINPTADVMLIGAHPDDVEACAGGMVGLMSAKNKNLVKVDLTSGELADTGSGDLRITEAASAAKILGISEVINLGFEDRALEQHMESAELALVELIRRFKPEILVAPYWEDKHVDHVSASIIASRAAATAKYSFVDSAYEPHKVSCIYYYLVHYEVKPSFVVDISSTYEQKMIALMQHKSQFLNNDGKIMDSQKKFLDYWEARSRVYGYRIGADYGEPFVLRSEVGVGDPFVIQSNHIL